MSDLAHKPDQPLPEATEGREVQPAAAEPIPGQPGLEPGIVAPAPGVDMPGPDPMLPAPDATPGTAQEMPGAPDAAAPMEAQDEAWVRSEAAQAPMPQPQQSVTAADVGARTRKPVAVEVMIPLIASREEFEFLKTRIVAVADAVQDEKGTKLTYQIGTMIELPRACLRAHEIAREAEFFSFGTNDLTQTAYGLSRDDSASFLGAYTARGIFEVDPFVSIDKLGVGELMEIGVKRGREARPDIKLGICGEHAGDPDSVDFCEQVGLDYVSCSPFRLPVARLAAAQAVLRRKQAKS